MVDVQFLFERLRDREITTPAIARVVVPTLADACVVDVLEPDGSHSKFELFARSAEKETYLRDLEQKYSSGLTPEFPALVAFRTGSPVLFRELNDELVSSWAEGADALAILRALAPRSTMALPLVARSQVIGVLSLHRFDDARPFSANDLATAEAIARLIAIAVDNARLFEALEAARGRLHRVLMSAPFAISLRRGPKHVLELANQRYYEMTRHSHETDLGKSFAESFPDLNEHALAMDRVYATGTGLASHEMYVNIRDDQGRPHDLYVDRVVQPVQDDKGRVDGLIAFTVDVTAQVRARKEVERLAESLQKAVRVRDEFLSIASHELKTPLTALRLQVQGLLRSSRAGEAARLAPERITARLDAIERNVDRLATLIDKLLSLPHLVSGRLELDKVELDLADLVEEVAGRFTDELARAGSALTMRLVRPLRGEWDRLRIDQVITNLLANAVKYGRGRPIEVTLEDTGNLAVLNVRDSGIGIAEADRERIFERFERAVSERNYGGFGLGLYIARHIAKAHGGTVSVASVLGEGATFRVELPKA